MRKMFSRFLNLWTTGTLSVFYPLFIGVSTLSAIDSAVDSWPCNYLCPEIIRKIDRKEVRLIVELDSYNGLNAVHLNRHYQCPVYSMDEWMKNQGVSAIDLLCTGLSEATSHALQGFGESLKDVKYILLELNEKTADKNNILFPAIKTYLKNREFRCLFDDCSLFSTVLFVNERNQNIISYLDIEEATRNFNTPLLTSLLPENLDSQFMYAVAANDHAAFHDLYLDKRLGANYQDENGNTTLMAAVANDSQYPAVKLLQDKRLNLSLKNKNGCTALMIAAALGRAVLVERILGDERGLATIHERNHQGMDAEEIARHTRSLEIAELIQLHKERLPIDDVPVRNEYPTGVIPEQVLICGVCKDVADYLPHTIKIIEKIGGLFKDYRVAVYENNSTDQTKGILKKWMTKNRRVDVQMENLNASELFKEMVNVHENGDFFKTELIARARNIVLDKALSAQYEDYPYLIVIDMDFVTPPPPESIIEIFQSQRDWDGVLAYGIGQCKSYWDWYAFRDFNQPLGPESLGRDWFGAKRWSLSRKDQWCPVYSAFGGCGIYKKSSIVGCRYSGIVTPDLEKVAKKIIDSGKTGHHPSVSQYLKNEERLVRHMCIPMPTAHLPRLQDPALGIRLQNQEGSLLWRMNSGAYQYPVVCEHVPFHASMIAHGHGKLFINPRLIFIYER